MSLNDSASQLFQGFSKLTRRERFERLIAMGALTAEDAKYLTSAITPPLELAEKFIENVIGYFPLPLGVATNFNIDGKDYVIPMAVEETSIIAALSKAAKWVRQHGHITTAIQGDTIIGQLQLAHVKDFENLNHKIALHKPFLIETANNSIATGLVKRGGGVRDITVRSIPRGDGDNMAVIHVFVDCCDAMGANILNQILEFLKTPVENITAETVTMCILSNLNDYKLTSATITLKDLPPDLALRLEEASIFAEQDPYRAATNNKGVLNGMDPILIATGNDWRAVEAGVHAYAARSGQYRSITTWRYDSGVLTGNITAPIIVGIVGGVTTLHPTAQLCLRMLNVASANELSRVIAAVGLMQNLAAIRALTTEGIIKGHMKLHLDNLSLSAGANEEEIPLLKSKLAQLLDYHKRVTLSHAIELLQELRLNNQAI